MKAICHMPIAIVGTFNFFCIIHHWYQNHIHESEFFGTKNFQAPRSSPQSSFMLVFPELQGWINSLFPQKPPQTLKLIEINRDYPPGNGYISHETGKEKNSTQKCGNRMEYVSSVHWHQLKSGKKAPGQFGFHEMRVNRKFKKKQFL